MTTKIVLAVRLFIAICFIILAGCVIYFKQYTKLTDAQTYGFAVLLVVYGIFRIYRAYKASDDIFIER